MTDRDNFGRRIESASMPEDIRETIMSCYGLLWLVQTKSKLIHRARRDLLQLLTKDEQRRGIETAKRSEKVK